MRGYLSLLVLVGVGLALSMPRASVALGDYARTVSYENEILLQCPDRSKPTVKVLEKHFDVWGRGQESIEIRMPRADYQSVKGYFPECTVLVQNLETHVQEAENRMFPARQREENAWAKAVVQEICTPEQSLAACERKMEEMEAKIQFDRSTSWFEEYHDYDAICSWYERLAKKNPTLVQYVPSIGKSVERRDLPAVHLTAAGDDPDRKKIYFQCLIHAREWISGSVCMYIANHMVENYGKNEEVTSLMDSLEFVMVPIVNPDGYVFSWRNDRLWRKNKAVTMDSTMGTRCMGVDLNRNFPQGWLESSYAAGATCADIYGGPDTASEPETKAVMSYFRKNAPIIGAIDWHSFDMLILRPWGWSQASTQDEERLKKLGNDMATLIKGVHSQTYTSETSHDLYTCYGIASDWFYSDDAASTNAGYRAGAYVVELRDKGQHGFLLPANQIKPTGEEIIPAVIHFAKTLSKDPLKYTNS